MSFLVREIASRCLDKTGTISVRNDIISVQGSTVPHSLKDALSFIRRHRCLPEAPSGLLVQTVTDSSITVTWSDNSDNEDGFELTRKREVLLGEVRTTKVGPNVIRHTFTGLIEDQEYSISVRAFNDGGKSANIKVTARTEPAPEPEPQKGVKQILVFNCNNARRLVHVWTRDITAGENFKERGSLNHQFNASGSCPNPAATPLAVSLTDGHRFEFVAVDPGLIGCDGRNDPTVGACRKFVFTAAISGDDDGVDLPIIIS